MVLQLLLIWAVAVGTLVWFIRDERRLRADAELARSARYYAHAPAYRYVPGTADNDEPAATPARATGGLTRLQREFFESLTQQDRRAQA